jgi:hypothetical protein
MSLHNEWMYIFLPMRGFVSEDRKKIFTKAEKLKANKEFPFVGERVEEEEEVGKKCKLLSFAK